MNINPNALKQWLDFYDHAMGGAVGGSSGMSGAMNQANYYGGRLAFAQQMLQQQPPQDDMPDYFARVPSTTSTPMAPQAGYNRLAALMGRRY